MALLTVRAAAQRLGVAYSTLKGWIYSGSVRTTTTAGGHHRISDAEIDRLIARGHASLRPEPPARDERRRPASRDSSAGGVIVALSGRNRLRGFVEEVRSDGLLAQVRLRIGDQLLTAVITADAVRELGLKRGDHAIAIVKSTEVMIAREAEQHGAEARAVARRPVRTRRAPSRSR
jgi:molybdopterin-binding protein